MKNKKIVSYLTSIITLVAMNAGIPLAYGAAIDITPPTDVENVKAQADDQSVTLTWDAATDDSGVIDSYRIYYGIESVTLDGGTYMYTTDTSNVLKYTIEDLSNDVTYYFAMTAVDGSGNESEFYSVEIGATPSTDVEPATTKSENEDDNTTDPVKETVTNNQGGGIEETEADSLDSGTAETDTSTTVEDTMEAEENTVPQETENTVEAEETVEQIADLIEPLIRDFVAQVEQETKVRVKWSIDQAEELGNQMFYQSEDGGNNYGEAKSLGKSIREYLVENLMPGKTYTFKLVTVHENGEEMDEAVTSITLPETGAGIAGLIAVSLGLGGIASRRKK